MKLVTAIFVLVMSTVSLSSPSEWIFHGNGEYQNAMGEKSSYSSTINKAMTAENTWTIVKNIFTEDGEAMTWSLRIVKNELGMIEVKNLEGEVIGSGYSFKDYAKKMMHIEFNTPSGSVEKTIVADLDGYKEIGSMTESETQAKSIWKEVGERVFPLQ